MKYIGSNMECSEDRLLDLQRAFDEYMSTHDYSCRMADVYNDIVRMPSRRFWVSPMRAAQVVSCMMKKDYRRWRKMRLSKRRMYSEIRYRVEGLMRKSKHPHHESIYALCKIVVEQPAPEFYLAPGSAKLMLCKARKKWIREKQKKSRHL